MRPRLDTHFLHVMPLDKQGRDPPEPKGNDDRDEGFRNGANISFDDRLLLVDGELINRFGRLTD